MAQAKVFKRLLRCACYAEQCYYTVFRCASLYKVYAIVLDL